MTQTTDLEKQDKANPQESRSTKMMSLRQELRLLLESFDKMQRKIKAVSYFTSNKGGKALAHRINGYRTKTRIAYMYHPHIKAKVTDPQSIADAFSAYYSGLYHLNYDQTMHQPSLEDINTFLNQVSFPKITTEQEMYLNAPS